MGDGLIKVKDNVCSLPECAWLECRDVIREVMIEGKWTLGEYTRKFEEEIADWSHRQFGIAVNSDTAGIEIVLRCLGIGNGDAVMFPANAFPSTPIPVLRVGGKPVFCDIELESFSLDVNDLERKLDANPSAKAVILMHTGGIISKHYVEICDICISRNLFLIEDCAHAIGSKRGYPAGKIGHAGIFSFYATKVLRTGEGGMIVTDSKDLEEKARMYRNYGKRQNFTKTDVAVEGYSWRMPEIEAIIGFWQAQNLEETVEARNDVAECYFKQLAEKNLRCDWKRPEVDEVRNWYKFLIMLEEGIYKEDVKKAMIGLGVQIPLGVYEIPTYKQDVFVERFGNSICPNVEEFCRRHMALPLYEGMTWNDVEIVVNALEKVIGR
jgi:dTDP-4-amino-4,6-dideoxygalactose transaminase